MSAHRRSAPYPHAVSPPLDLHESGLPQGGSPYVPRRQLQASNLMTLLTDRASPNEHQNSKSRVPLALIEGAVEIAQTDSSMVGPRPGHKLGGRSKPRSLSSPAQSIFHPSIADRHSCLSTPTPTTSMDRVMGTLAPLDSPRPLRHQISAASVDALVQSFSRIDLNEKGIRHHLTSSSSSSLSCSVELSPPPCTSEDRNNPSSLAQSAALYPKQPLEVDQAQDSLVAEEARSTSSAAQFGVRTDAGDPRGTTSVPRCIPRRVTHPTELTNLDDFNAATSMGPSQLVLVQFYRSYWCPCRAMSEALKRYAKVFPQVHFHQVEFDVCEAIVEYAKVHTTPIVQFYRDGACVAVVTSLEEQHVLDKIHELLRAATE